MLRSPILRPRSFVVVILALIFAATAYGFAAANTVPGSTAGDGSGAVSGYTISAIHYTLNTANPGKLDAVAFTTAPAIAAPGVVTVQVSQGAATTWHSCAVGATVSCDLTQDNTGAATNVTALGITNLRVVAAQ
jgi:hypothetical protein